MTKTIKKTVNQFIKQHNLTVVNYHTLKDAVNNMGYTIIEFNSICNDKDVETVIQNLALSEAVIQSRGFTYASKDYRLIFINEDLNNEEKLLVLAHELGHIVCKHFTSNSIIGKDVKDEYEANEFSHYLLKESILRNFKIGFYKHRKLIMIVVILLIVALSTIVTGIAINKKQSYYGDYYITITGKKYHQSECIHVKNKNNVQRLTEEQFEAGDYEPCGTCLPQG